MMLKDQITFEDFAKIDVRVGEIVECENVEKSDKLLKLVVDFGDLGQRQILTGLAMWYKPDDMIGMKTTFLLNLEPRKMMGLESQGMILALGLDHTKKPIFVTPANEVENGEGLN